MPRMTDWPTSLIERIKARQAILVAGLGCSRLVGRPGWAELGERLCEWLDRDDERERVRALLGAGRIATAITFLRSRLSDDVVVEVLKDAYPPGAPADGAGAKDLGLIARIPWRGVIATGFDDLWEGLLTPTWTVRSRRFSRATRRRWAATAGVSCCGCAAA
jgi:hypothetical protein